MFVFNFFKQNLPKCFHSFFNLTINRHEHNTRNKTFKLVLPIYSTKTYGKNSIKYQCISEWNNQIIPIKRYFTRKYGANSRYKNFLR